MIVHLRFLFPFHGKSDKERYPSSMNKESQHWTIITPFIIVHILCGLWYISPFGSIFTLISSRSPLILVLWRFFSFLSFPKEGWDKKWEASGRRYIENRAESESNWLFFHIRIFLVSVIPHNNHFIFRWASCLTTVSHIHLMIYWYSICNDWDE